MKQAATTPTRYPHTRAGLRAFLTDLIAKSNAKTPTTDTAPRGVQQSQASD